MNVLQLQLSSYKRIKRTHVLSKTFVVFKETYISFFYLPSTKCHFKLDYLLKAADSDALPIMNAKVTETKTPVCMVSSLNIFFDFKHKLTKEHLK